MKLRQIFAFWYRNALVTRRSFPDLFTIVFWPLTLMISMGMFSFLVIGEQSALITLIIGSVGWSYAYSAQVDASYTLIRDIWWRSVKKLYLLPLSLVEIMFASWSYGLFRAGAVFVICSVSAAAIFNFNPLATAALPLLVILFGMSVFGLGTGLLINSAVLRFGHRADVLVWSVTDILMLFSCVFWPLSALPPPFSWVAQLSPMTWAFEGLRGLYMSGFMVEHVIRLYTIDIIYVVFAAVIFIIAERTALRNGFFQRYE